MTLFREITVWKRVDKRQAIKFNCLEDMNLHKFVVQSADFFTLPLKKERFEEFDKQFVELFIEIKPSDRRKWFDSIEEAIAAHETQFT